MRTFGFSDEHIKGLVCRLVYFCSLLVSIQLIGCASVYENPNLKLVPEGDYYNLVEKQTQKKQIYDGFMNVLDLSATFHSRNLAMAQVDHYARIFQWSTDQYSSERAKVEGDLGKETAIFLSFFVPERKHDDLSKTATKWKIFLDVSGKRYEGKATKLKTLLSEIQNLYPHHTRWQSAYKVVFPVNTSISETADRRLTFTGPVASIFVEYKAEATPSLN